MFRRKKGYPHTFSLQVLGVLDLPAGLRSKYVVEWKRGGKRSGTTQPSPANPRGEVEFNEEFSFTGTLFRGRNSTSAFDKKVLKLTLLQYDPKKRRKVSSVEMNLSDFCSPDLDNETKSRAEQVIYLPLKIRKQPMARLAVRLRPQYSGKGEGSQTAMTDVSIADMSSMAVSIMDEIEEDFDERTDEDVASDFDAEDCPSLEKEDKETPTPIPRSSVAAAAGTSGRGETTPSKVGVVETKSSSSTSSSSISTSTSKATTSILRTGQGSRPQDGADAVRRPGDSTVENGSLVEQLPRPQPAVTARMNASGGRGGGAIGGSSAPAHSSTVGNSNVARTAELEYQLSMVKKDLEQAHKGCKEAEKEKASLQKRLDEAIAFGERCQASAVQHQLEKEKLEKRVHTLEQEVHQTHMRLQEMEADLLHMHQEERQHLSPVSSSHPGAAATSSHPRTTSPKAKGCCSLM